MSSRALPKYPDRFPGYAASLPMNAPCLAAREAERVLSQRRQCDPAAHQRGRAPIDAEHFWPIYEIIEKSGRPILLHPIRTREMADDRTEEKSKSEICSVIGWPYETGAALAGLVFSGLVDRYSGLKITTHHLWRGHSLCRGAGGALLGSARLGSARRAHFAPGLRIAC